MRETVRLGVFGSAIATAVVGVSALTGYVVDVRAERDRFRAEAAALRARPPVVVTATPTPPSAPPSAPPRTLPTPAAVPPIVTVSADSPAGEAPGGRSAGRDDPAGRGPPGRPGDTEPGRDCPTGRIITINAPVGVLPCDAAVIGGARDQEG